MKLHTNNVDRAGEVTVRTVRMAGGRNFMGQSCKELFSMNMDCIEMELSEGAIIKLHGTKQGSPAGLVKYEGCPH
jgi:hypothetical protein